MRFLVDAQLPPRLGAWLRDLGHDVLHTLDLTDGNTTTDAEICRRADREQRVVVTKDADFVSSHELRASPKRLLLVSTGNVSNDELLAIWAGNIGMIESAFDDASFVELQPTRLIVRG